MACDNLNVLYELPFYLVIDISVFYTSFVFLAWYALGSFRFYIDFSFSVSISISICISIPVIVLVVLPFLCSASVNCFGCFVEVVVVLTKSLVDAVVVVVAVAIVRMEGIDGMDRTNWRERDGKRDENILEKEKKKKKDKKERKGEKNQKLIRMSI